MQPRSERALAAKEVQLLPRPDEDILCQLFGTQSICDHARAKRKHPVDVLTVKALEGLAIPRSG
jgi:hypothetical protein